MEEVDDIPLDTRWREALDVGQHDSLVLFRRLHYHPPLLRRVLFDVHLGSGADDLDDNVGQVDTVQHGRKVTMSGKVLPWSERWDCLSEGGSSTYRRVLKVNIELIQPSDDLPSLLGGQYGSLQVHDRDLIANLAKQVDRAGCAACRGKSVTAVAQVVSL